MNSKPKEEFPLKGILKSSCCGTNMTVGWSKGKNKDYLYYRRISHSNLDISGAMLHDKFNELLRNLSFPQSYIDEITAEVERGLKETLIVRDKQLQVARTQLLGVEKKIENTEKNLLEEVINGGTYKKWMKKLMAEKAKLDDEISFLASDLEDFIKQELLVLPYTLNLPKVFEGSSLNQRHAIIYSVFKQKFTYREGMFRKPFINPAFAHNVLRLKEKGLLEVEQPSKDFDTISSCGDKGLR